MSGRAYLRICRARMSGLRAGLAVGALHLIGETVSEMLDNVPARLRVTGICRPAMGCRTCVSVHQAPASERPVAKGFATPALLAHVKVSE
jgi:transposase